MSTLNQRLGFLERQRARLSRREQWGAWCGLEITPASTTACLLAIADEAKTLGVPAALSIARQALMDVAKLNGLIVERRQTVTRSPEERAARLAELRAERERLARAH